MVGRSRPALTQTSRLFGFRIHDGSDSAQNFGAQFRSWGYVQACVTALDNGEPEPTLEEWQAAQEDQRLTPTIATMGLQKKGYEG